MMRRTKVAAITAVTGYCFAALVSVHTLTDSPKKEKIAENKAENITELGLLSKTAEIGLNIGASTVSFMQAAGDGMEAAPALEEELLEAPIPTLIPSPIPTPFEYDKVVAKVNEYVNVRTEASTESEIAGKLYKDSYGTIIERGEEWTKISSGDVIGYVNNDYLYFDEKATEYARSQDALVAEVTAGTVNIRTEPNTDCEVVGEVKLGDTLPVYPEQSEEGFYAVEYNNQTAYITQDFSEVKLEMTKAVSKEAEEAAKRKEEEENAKRKAEEERINKASSEQKYQEEVKQSVAKAKETKIGKTSRTPVTVSDDEIYLIATVVSSEALYESYEGKLAVANVVVNRLVSGIWGNTVYDVVYAPGQFSGANSDRLKKYAKLMNEDCKKAAVEALAGVNNIDDYMYFRTKSSATYSSYSKYYILGNHCFYQR